jgi:hypothetical protein
MLSKHRFTGSLLIHLSSLLMVLAFTASGEVLSGFKKSIYADEQVCWFHSPAWAPEANILINAPSAQNFDSKHKTIMVLYATPNGNTIEQTIGNSDLAAVDWHYNIQHIGAQVRYLRAKMANVNLVVCYLESKQKSWGSWRQRHADADIGQMVDELRRTFHKYNPSLVLSGHSGGGNFIFGYINNCRQIPSFIERIAFLDSNYAYDEGLAHGRKLTQWLQASEHNALCILAYNDSIALYEGKTFVGPTGGTWRRSNLMAQCFKKYFEMEEKTDSEFIRYSALSGRLNITLKTNPQKAILHTVQVERNGFIHSLLTGTSLEENEYVYYHANEPKRVYSSYIQKGVTMAGAQFPERPGQYLKGSEFMQQIEGLPRQQREAKVLEQLSQGNIPDFLRSFVKIKLQHENHTAWIEVLPDYLAIGDNVDFCRMPMTPQTAQAYADFVGCSLPTARIVDAIQSNATYRLDPVAYKPNGHDNEQSWMFERHHKAIEKRLLTYKINRNTEIIDGIKKDVVLCNQLAQLTNKVAIYGWHKPDGTVVQPLYTGHVNWYVDYSHGIRLINRLVWLDDKPAYIDEILSNPNLCKILSSEPGPMKRTKY